MRVGKERVEHFAFLCAFAVRRVNVQVCSETCISTLRQLAEQGGVPIAAAAAIIERTFADAGLPLRADAIQQSCGFRRSRPGIPR
jgi:hypothetical protein